ncbi:hypothetical protein [Nitrosopumilus sp.]|uniref:hypothetical protein n=1 Tax=Nitrosopumilus sp. TaxID=2024843 RepID=UPI00247EB7D0|nr:hypothetical protein [Nitrosopumilus sp.]MCV0430049.1 hypothetical protein [Nitrosopumilus sp.]
MNCQRCSKKKKEYEVWNNKIVISATYDSEFQNHDEIRKMDDKSIICHDCIQAIKDEVNQGEK